MHLLQKLRELGSMLNIIISVVLLGCFLAFIFFSANAYLDNGKTNLGSPFPENLALKVSLAGLDIGNTIVSFDIESIEMPDRLQLSSPFDAEELFLADNEEICIEKIYIDQFFRYGPSTFSRVLVGANEYLYFAQTSGRSAYGDSYPCFGNGETSIGFSNSQRISEESSSSGTRGVLSTEPFFFPFDTYEARIKAQVFARIVDDTGATLREVVIDPVIVGDVGIPRWSSSASGTSPEGISLVASGERHAILKIITLVILLTITFFILSITFITDRIAKIEIAIAILFSLWGIREIIVPQSISGNTIIDTIILSLYGLLSLTLISSFVAQPLIAKLRSNEQNNGENDDLEKPVSKEILEDLDLDGSEQQVSDRSTSS